MDTLWKALRITVHLARRSMFVSVLAAFALVASAWGGYTQGVGFIHPGVYSTLAPVGLPAVPGVLPTTVFRTTLSQAAPDFRSGTFHGVPRVLERFPLPSYLLRRPLYVPHHGGLFPAGSALPVVVQPAHGSGVPVSPVAVGALTTAPHVGGAIVGGRPAVRAIVPRIPAVTENGIPEVRPLPAPDHIYPPHPYKFGYESVDEFGNTQYRHETSDARNSKRGSYGYTDANGISRRVDYVADEHGFRASVRTNEPGTAVSAPADVVYHAKPVVALGPAVLKAQRNGLLLKDAGSGGSAVPGATTVVVPAPVATKLVAAPEAVVAAPYGAYVTGSAPSALELVKTTTRVQGPVAVPGVVGPVVVATYPDFIRRSGKVDDDGDRESGVVATKVLTAPAASRDHGPRLTVGAVVVQPGNLKNADRYEYKAKLR